MTSSNGVTKNAPATAYTPTPHALDALMKALDDDAVPIKKEPESDPIYRERSFTLAQSISSLVHAPTIEPESIDGVKSASKQEPASLHSVEDTIMIDSNANDHAHSDVSTDDGLKDDYRSRVSSISGIGPDCEMGPKVQLKHEVYLANQPQSAYSTILKGAEPKTKLEHQPSNSASLPKRHSTIQLGTRANQTYACYTRGLSNGDASRAAFKDMYCAEDFQVYLRALGRLKGLEGTEWPNYAAISLPTLAASAKSRNKEQERQLLQALRSYRKPEEVQIYLDAITPESGLTQRTNALNDQLQRDIVDAERLENQRAAQVARLAEKKASDLVEQNAQMQQRLKAQQFLKETEAQEQKKRSAQAMVEQLLKEKAEKARRYSRQLQDQKAELAKEGIETRRRLAPRRLVSESESQVTVQDAKTVIQRDREHLHH
ncbi:hypothetical protein D6D01_05535 [Aureobasidium pullulans]|uniref:Uncharacterized protein n=1 Tax=Aureobasidium pullulans TaxID=5580 RepID=A0A4S9L6V3_AURPU|nr:hypothetical protein D6D01_05535 [Aureobasidium pullulans]